MTNMVYFFFSKAGKHNMPLHKTLKAEFKDWDSYVAFLGSDLMEREGGVILACYGHDGSDLPPEWKAKVKKAIPDMDNAILVRIKWLDHGIALEAIGGK